MDWKSVSAIESFLPMAKSLRELQLSICMIARNRVQDAREESPARLDLKY